MPHFNLASTTTTLCFLIRLVWSNSISWSRGGKEWSDAAQRGALPSQPPTLMPNNDHCINSYVRFRNRFFLFSGASTIITCCTLLARKLITQKGINGVCWCACCVVFSRFIYVCHCWCPVHYIIESALMCRSLLLAFALPESGLTTATVAVEAAAGPHWTVCRAVEHNTQP